MPASFANATSSLKRWVVTGDDEDPRGGVDADTERVEQVWRALEHELRGLRVEPFDFLVESDLKLRNRLARDSSRLPRSPSNAPWSAA